MGRNSRQHRTAKQKRNRTARGPTPPRSGSGQSRPAASAADEFDAWFDGWASEDEAWWEAAGAFGRSADPPPRQVPRGERARHLVDDLVAQGHMSAETKSSLGIVRLVSDAEADILAMADAILGARLLADIARLWEAGWQPADLLHVTARISKRTAAVAADAAVRQLEGSGMAQRAPRAWRDQLDECAERARSAGLREGVGTQWRVVASLQHTAVSAMDSWVAAVALVAQVEALPRLERFLPPPSAWSTSAPPRPTDGPRSEAAGRDKVLVRIRALLAKAEATPYAAEAEAFTGKAQDLMTRHAIDEALVRAAAHERVDVGGRRIHIDNPYLAEKTHLLSVVGRANRAKVVWMEGVAMATVVGTPVDVDQVEMLFVSLLVQATRAMAAAGAERAGSFDRSATFRRSFLAAYAVRIGERLSEADQAARSSYGSELVPVLQRQAEAVDAEFERMFPRTEALANRRWYDRDGWAAGRKAADAAVFVAGRLAG